MIDRSIEETLVQAVDRKKAILLKGARQVGKTTLIKKLFDHENTLWIDGDDIATASQLSRMTKEGLKLLVEKYDYVIVDEAQRIENIGLSLKMLLDSELGIQFVVLGSSTLNINSTINEPLTGRKWTFELFPLSWQEISNHYNPLHALSSLENILIYGSYPEVYTSEKKKRLLSELTSTYLYKDILELGDIRKPNVLQKLLQSLALKIGSEVSYHELANMLRVDSATIERYIDLLEESNVLFRLTPLSHNPRKEISTSRKIYFYDNGVRNAIINNFSTLPLRNDKGMLWENYIVSEIVKKNANKDKIPEYFFWRSKGGAEVDLIIKQSGAFEAIEIKYNSKKKGRFVKSFMEEYNPINTLTIHPDNFFEYLNLDHK